MKWLMISVLVLLVGGSWLMFSMRAGEIRDLREEISKAEDLGDPQGIVPDLKSKADGLDGEKTFIGILLTFLCAGVAGILFVVYLLPFFAQRVTHAVYDSAEMIERDVMHDARSLLAQGEYESAIEAFRQAAAAEPLNRLPWVEIAKIYKDNLHDPASAIQTIRHALESQEWEISDAAYFLFRLAELYNDVGDDHAAAVAIMQQVVDQFPGTRHSANASNKLHEWSLQDEEDAAAGAGQEAAEAAGQADADAAAQLAREEEELLARLRAEEQEENVEQAEMQLDESGEPRGSA